MQKSKGKSLERPQTRDLISARREPMFDTSGLTVFYSPHTLHVEEKSGPELCPDHAIPSHSHPSDHVPMEVVFAWGLPAHNATSRWHGLFKAITVGADFGFLENMKKMPEEVIKAGAALKFSKAVNWLDGDANQQTRDGLLVSGRSKM